MKRADLIVLVKRPSPGMVEDIRKSGKPWVWDIVDAYPQPECTAWPKEKACAWVRQQIKALKPNAVIWPNRRMAEDCGGGERDLVLYHHHRPGIAHNPVRADIKSVGYEGSSKYLVRWGGHILKACQERGWDFHINTGVHADWDICLAFRDDEFNGYAQRHWKSNVKLANAHGSGTPFIGQREDGYLETRTDLEVWCEKPQLIGQVMDSMRSMAFRQRISKAFKHRAYSVEQAASDLSKWLETV